MSSEVDTVTTYVKGGMIQRTKEALRMAATTLSGEKMLVLREVKRYMGMQAVAQRGVSWINGGHWGVGDDWKGALYTSLSGQKNSLCSHVRPRCDHTPIPEPVYQTAGRWRNDRENEALWARWDLQMAVYSRKRPRQRPHVGGVRRDLRNPAQIWACD